MSTTTTTHKPTLKVCTVCSANQNRSMEAHRVLEAAGYTVSSFGTGSMVRLPGPSLNRPNTYAFGTPYNDIYKDLEKKDVKLYTHNGVLTMLNRNRKIKEAPQRWIEHKQTFDVVFTCEERCFDIVCHDLMNRGAPLNKLVHVINVDIKDNHEDAKIGAKGILELANMLEEAQDEISGSGSGGDVDTKVMEIIEKWQKNHKNLPAYYSPAYF